MTAPSSATLFELKEGATTVMASSQTAGTASQRKKRNQPGNPSPDAEVVALSPNTLIATNRFLCEVCNKGFKREQNLQLHRRGHNLPWKLKQKTNNEVRKKVYICPEPGCVHHNPSRALGDLTGIKKHYFRKHGEKKFSCSKCNKKYAVHSDWKAHNKICGTKEYKCKCGTSFSRRDSFIYHRSFCEPLADELARHTTNRSPYSSRAAGLLANASNPGTAAGSLIPSNHHQLSSSLFGPNSFTSLLSGQSVGSAFQSTQPPNRLLLPVPEPKLKFPKVPDFSGIPSYTAPTNMFSLGFDGDADFNSPENDLDLDINNSFTGLLMNAEASAYNIMESTPSAQFSATALLQKAALTGASSSNATLMKSMRSSLSGGMKFDNYGGALGDQMSASTRGGGSAFGDMYSNLNVGGGGAGGYRSGMEYLCDEMDAPYGGMMYNVKNADGMLVGEMKNNAAVVETQMIAGSEYSDNHTRDFLGMQTGMNNMAGGRMVGDHNAHGIGTDSVDSKATTSAEARPFLPGSRRSV